MPRAVTLRLVNALRNYAVAALLGIKKDRPGRWVSGKDSPNEENRAQLADLDALVGHLHGAFTPAQATLWLEGQDRTWEPGPSTSIGSKVQPQFWRPSALSSSSIRWISGAY